MEVQQCIKPRCTNSSILSGNLKTYDDSDSVFRNKTIKDIFRKTHTFENDPDKILDILARQEDREFFTIYESDDIGN